MCAKPCASMHLHTCVCWLLTLFIHILREACLSLCSTPSFGQALGSLPNGEGLRCLQPLRNLSSSIFGGECAPKFSGPHTEPGSKITRTITVFIKPLPICRKRFQARTTHKCLYHSLCPISGCCGFPGLREMGETEAQKKVKSLAQAQTISSGETGEPTDSPPAE